MRPVSIRFLGRFELRPPSGGEERLNGMKTVLLLARLTMPPGETHDRKRLSELLWSDRGEAQALASLRQSLWSLRKGLGKDGPSTILAERSFISVDPCAVVVDTSQFEQLIRSGTKADLEHAVEIYRGDFLAEFDLDDLDTYAPFLFERRRLREMALYCLRTLIEMRAGSGDPDGAVEIAQRALSFDPLQEDVHAAVIRLHRDRGRFGLARDQYDICRDLLHRELGIRPSAEIEGLMSSIRAPPVPTAALKKEGRDLARPPLAEPTPPRLTIRNGSRPAWMRWGVVAMAAAAILYLLQAVRPDTDPIARPVVSDGRPSLVVLPFEDVSADSQQAAFAAGLTDHLIADLSKVSELFVIAPETSRIAANSERSAQEIGAAMGVDYVLRGSVQRSPVMFRIAAQLVRTKTGQSIWAERYDRPASDIFDVQDDVVQRIAASLKIELSDRERRTITHIPTRNLEAYDFYLRAEYQNAGLTEPTSYRRSIAAYHHAIELDPEFADAYAGYAHLAATIWRRDFNEIMSSAMARQEAYAAAGKALQLDPDNARANEVLSIIQAVDGEHQIAIDSARKAVELQPGEAESHTNLANVLYIAGDLEAAAAEVELARQLNPALSTELRLLSAALAFAQGRFAEAISEFNAIQELVPRSDLVLEHLAAAYAYLGDTERSREIVAELKKVVPIANLGFYAVLRENVGTPQQTARLIEGLRLAGLPEWPYDDRRKDEDRLSSDELRTLSAGPVWTGELQNGVDFIQYFDRSGGFAYRSTTSLLTGHVAIQGDQLCQIIDGYLLNRPTCGYVYRNTPASNHRPGQFAYVSIDAVKYFSVSR